MLAIREKMHWRVMLATKNSYRQQDGIVFPKSIE